MKKRRIGRVRVSYAHLLKALGLPPDAEILNVCINNVALEEVVLTVEHTKIPYELRPGDIIPTVNAVVNENGFVEWQQ